MSKYMQVFENRIKSPRQSIGKAQAEIMAGRNLANNRKLIAKCLSRIAAQKKLIAINQPKG